MCVCAESRTEGSKGGGLVLEMALRRGGESGVCVRALVQILKQAGMKEKTAILPGFSSPSFPPKNLAAKNKSLRKRGKS